MKPHIHLRNGWWYARTEIHDWLGGEFKDVCLLARALYLPPSD